MVTVKLPEASLGRLMVNSGEVALLIISTETASSTGISTFGTFNVIFLTIGLWLSSPE